MVTKTDLERIKKLSKTGHALAEERNLSKEELDEKFGFWASFYDLKLAALGNQGRVGKAFKQGVKMDLKKIMKAGGDVYHLYGELRSRAGK